MKNTLSKHNTMKKIFILTLTLVTTLLSCATQPSREILNFDDNWKFNLGDAKEAFQYNYNDAAWRSLDLPHDWSIEGKFDERNPATPGGGALPGGIGWYRKTFVMPETAKGKSVFVDFDGVYRNSEVWVNGNYLGKRPNGYLSFRYELTPYLYFGKKKNVIAVRADNSDQPNSRWYSGSGIYRNVWLTITGQVQVKQWGTHIEPEVNGENATVKVTSSLSNTTNDNVDLVLRNSIVNVAGKKVAETNTSLALKAKDESEIAQKLSVTNPSLWSIETPNLYKMVTEVEVKGKVIDRVETPFGIRSIAFDINKGFFLNGKSVKIKGVCNHHDLGCLGAALNTRALQRQLEILKEMGCNAIRTSHNAPAPELLDLCDKMGFLVMDEAFDMWMKKKSPYDYSQYFKQWHVRDLTDQVMRDRNHPSVIVWSVGNEILEQFGEDAKGDSSGVKISRDLVAIVKGLDTSRPIVTANNNPEPTSNLIKSGAFDMIGYNYEHKKWGDFQKTHPGKSFIVTESTSALATRGWYEMASDSVRNWPVRWDIPFDTDHHSCSSYDNWCAPWGSTHETSWKLVKKLDYIAGFFIWTGFDYLGEPTPYGWPARSSYFGIIDLAGFPKDVYYMYQSEWRDKPVLHLFPHWNWKPGQIVDLMAYYNNADEVELFLNGKSLGIKRKQGEELHVMWRVTFEPGTLKAVSRKNGKVVLTKEIKTAGNPAKIELIADRNNLTADGKDLSFITVNILDKDGNIVPYAENLVKFSLEGNGKIAGVDNGSPISHESFKANERKAFYGKCMVVVQSDKNKGIINLKAVAEGLQSAETSISTK